MALRFMTNAIKKRSIVFLISDFIGGNYEDALKIAARKHDVVALRIVDPREEVLPDAGLIRLKDAESGEELWIDSASESVRENYRKRFLKKEGELKQLFARCGVDSARLRTNESYVQPLMNLFKKRGTR